MLGNELPVSELQIGIRSLIKQEPLRFKIIMEKASVCENSSGVRLEVAEMKEKLLHFMQGRYGVDAYSRFLLTVSFILLAVSLFVRTNLFYVLAVAVLFYTYFRMLSKNHAKRYEENEKFRFFKEKIKNVLKRKTNNREQKKTHRIYSCPTCGQKIRIPRGKGKVEIRCPKCQAQFIKRR